MEVSKEGRLTNRSVSLGKKACGTVRITSNNPTNPGQELGKQPVCPTGDAGTQKLLKYCCKKAAAIYAEWERNSK